MVWQSQLRDLLISAVVVTLMFAAFAGFLLRYQQRELPADRLEPVLHPMSYPKANFTPTELTARIPNIKVSACFFSEKAVRHYVAPARIGFPSCGASGLTIAVAENLVDITVSGEAIVEQVNHPFTVVLQHNPVSVTEDGLIVISIDVIGFEKTKSPEAVVSRER